MQAKGLTHPPNDNTVLRFQGASRLVHWTHAVPFLFLLLSGLILFLPQVKAPQIGGYRVVPLLHVIVGIAFILSPIPVYLSLRARSASDALHDDARRLFHFDPSDKRWASYALAGLIGARARIPPTGKFNLGQKLNTIFSIAVTAGLMLSGAVLAVNFFSKAVFSAHFVEQVFPIHDFFMLIALPVLAAHIYLGSLHPSTRESLRGILNGRVRRSWARRHHALWLDETDREDRE